MKIKLILSILVTFALFSCKNDTPVSQDMYFGGLIVNPTSKFVVLLKKDVVVDTFYLDSENKFGGKLINAEKGLYVFKHPPENQIMYLEPGDSTLILLNTLEFDESLTFSGIGAAKSNFLNKMYLLNQDNNDLILSYYKLDPAVFAAKTDSIRERRKQTLEKVHGRNNFSEDFYQLANATINYEYYDLRERYAFLLRKHSREYLNQLPANFHDYRKEISFNDENLEDYYVYLNLIDDYLRTRSLEYCDENNIKNKGCYDLSDYNNIKRRISFVDSLIDNERIKNTFVDRLAAQGIIYSKSREELIAILDLLKDINYTGGRMEDLRQMAGIQNALLPGNNLGEMRLLNTRLDTVSLKNISNKPKVTYHWSVNAQRHHKWQHKLIEDLREKYPEIDFIGINIDKDQVNEWANVITNQKYPANYEFKLSLVRINDVLLKNYLNKLVFLDSKGKIVRGDVQLNSLDYETSILEFLSKN
ncbi:MAG: hypothetical protein ABJ092_15215 [Gillisia sp.]